MSVYVGELFVTMKSKAWPYSQACHLFCGPSKDLQELHKMAQSIGLRPAWFQRHITMPHYDLTPNKRYHAIRNGAIAATMEVEAEIIGDWREFKKSHHRDTEKSEVT